MDRSSKELAVVVGSNIKAFREKNNLTQQDLADKIKMPYKTDRAITRDSIAKYECGSVLPPITNIAAIASALNIGVFALMPRSLQPKYYADNAIDLFDLMSDILDFSWSYDENAKTFRIEKDNTVAAVPSVDIVALYGKTSNQYNAELYTLIRQYEITNEEHKL